MHFFGVYQKEYSAMSVAQLRRFWIINKLPLILGETLNIALNAI